MACRDSSAESSAARGSARENEVHLMEPILQPVYFGPPTRRLFGVYHAPSEPPRGAVLMCPPLLNEHFRSYRFFSQVASQLAGAGLACLRFDYLGTGDSDGGDDQFNPGECSLDIALAANELSLRSGDAPLILMAIRGSALFAYREAENLGASALWLWQPVIDGAGYVQALEKRDRFERDSRYRYPLLRGMAAAGPQDLMGFALSVRFRSELAAYSIDRQPCGVRTAVLAHPDDPAMQLAADARLELPASVTAWSDELDLTSLIPLRDARDALEALVSDIPRWTAHG
jgi:uncharacterized protein